LDRRLGGPESQRLEEKSLAPAGIIALDSTLIVLRESRLLVQIALVVVWKGNRELARDPVPLSVVYHDTALHYCFKADTSINKQLFLLALSATLRANCGRSVFIIPSILPEGFLFLMFLT
jgi:hypothetical protein